MTEAEIAKKLQAAQDQLIQQWREDGTVHFRLRMLIEDLICCPDIQALPSHATRLQVRIERIKNLILEQLGFRNDNDRCDATLVKALELLARFLLLLDAPDFCVNLTYLVDVLTRRVTDRQFPEYHAKIKSAEIEKLFEILANYRRRVPEHDPRLEALLAAIVTAGSRGVLKTDSEALKSIKSGLFSRDLLLNQFNQLVKEQKDAKQGQAVYGGFEMTAKALGFAIIGELTSRPGQWPEVIAKATSPNPPLRSLPFGINQALCPGVPSRWPSETDYAGDLWVVLELLGNYALMNPAGNDRWKQIADILQETRSKLGAIHGRRVV
ncbi:MAG: hypothetical protein NTZ65_00575 [Candidatus Berkelbacteria bacterium]|nr:hypothetical protein [Candidatus Berkelbacteria bacterium]